MRKASREDWILFLAGGCGLGALPFAPGTWGTLGALPLWLLLSGLGWGRYLFVVLLLSLAAIWLSGRAGRIFQVEDSPVIVIDEIVGLLLGLTGVSLSFGHALAAFLLFRFFDIVKPFPADWCDDNLGGGLGVVADDLVAGVMTWLVMTIFF